MTRRRNPGLLPAWWHHRETAKGTALGCLYDLITGVDGRRIVSNDEIIREVPALKDHRDDILGRAMLCRRTNVFPVECVIRGYISGSAWKEYAASGTLAGEKLKAGLVESEKLEQPIFSPATKAETGHDENITIARVRGPNAARSSPSSNVQSGGRSDTSLGTAPAMIASGP